MRQILLQNTGAILLQNATEVYYKIPQVFYYKLWRFCYKIRQLLQNATILLQKCNFYFGGRFDAYLTLRNNRKIQCLFVIIRKFCVYLMHYWIILTLNTNAFSHIRGVEVNWTLLSCIGIVSSTDKRHFLVINLSSKVLQDEDIS